MPGLATITVIGLVVLAVLTVIFLRVRRTDQIGALMEKRRARSKLVSRAEHVEGVGRMEVALSLSADSLYYENPDMEASFELNRIDEVEYGDELSTGKVLEDDFGVLRLRSHGRAFEFVLAKGELPKWRAALPPRAMGTSAEQAV